MLLWIKSYFIQGESVHFFNMVLPEKITNPSLIQDFAYSHVVFASRKIKEMNSASNKYGVSHILFDYLSYDKSIRQSFLVYFGKFIYLYISVINTI